MSEATVGENINNETVDVASAPVAHAEVSAGMIVAVPGVTSGHFLVLHAYVDGGDLFGSWVPVSNVADATNGKPVTLRQQIRPTVEIFHWSADMTLRNYFVSGFDPAPLYLDLIGSQAAMLDGQAVYGHTMEQNSVRQVRTDDSIEPNDVEVGMVVHSTESESGLALLVLETQGWDETRLLRGLPVFGTPSFRDGVTLDGVYSPQMDEWTMAAAPSMMRSLERLVGNEAQANRLLAGWAVKRWSDLIIANEAASTWESRVVRLANGELVTDEWVERVTERLHRLAEAESWCPDFDDEMESFGLPRRMHEYDVTARVTVTVDVPFRVRAASEESAREAAKTLYRGQTQVRDLEMVRAVMDDASLEFEFDDGVDVSEVEE